MKCGWKKILNDFDRWSLQHWWDQIVEKQLNSGLCLILKLRVYFRTHNEKGPQGLGAYSCVALRKALISEANQEQRLQFAREHKELTFFLCFRVMWSDECRFPVMGHHGKKRGSPHARVQVQQQYTDRPSYSIIGVFTSPITRWHCQNSHMLATRVQTLRIFVQWRRLHAVVLLSRHEYKILVKNECKGRK